MKQFVNVVILLSVLLHAHVVLAEKTIDYPIDAPLVTITVPKNWESITDEGAMMLQPKTTKVKTLPTMYFSYETSDTTKMVCQDDTLIPPKLAEIYFKATLELEQLETLGRGTIERNGLILKYYDGVSKTADGDLFVTLSYVYPIESTEGAIVMVYFALDKANEAFSADIQSIYDSIQAK